jgi:hypothetical protein
MKRSKKERWQDRLAASEPMHARRCALEFCDAGLGG